SILAVESCAKTDVNVVAPMSIKIIFLNIVVHFWDEKCRHCCCGLVPEAHGYWQCFFLNKRKFVYPVLPGVALPANRDHPVKQSIKG
ncbi:MAG: hypothetical protein MUE71_07875, partial [Chitinophagaceae bacterium]|nr:hypothetical protein [Chitinophagaceae bacterium]